MMRDSCVLCNCMFSLTLGFSFFCRHSTLQTAGVPPPPQRAFSVDVCAGIHALLRAGVPPLMWMFMQEWTIHEPGSVFASSSTFPLPHNFLALPAVWTVFLGYNSHRVLWILPSPPAIHGLSVMQCTYGFFFRVLQMLPLVHGLHHVRWYDLDGLVPALHHVFPCSAMMLRSWWWNFYMICSAHELYSIGRIIT